jgi:hypothetical protein|tara:strand:- start:87 stop:461 length:375 start_codon:yes stop_codon:yes gene_type:complete
MSYVQAFNKQCLNFLGEMAKTYPENKEILPIKNQYLLITKTNERWGIQNFIDTCWKFYPNIKENDERFFLEYDLSGTILDELNLKKIWTHANDNTKKQIWLYIKVIFKIVEKYTNSKNLKKISA